MKILKMKDGASINMTSKINLNETTKKSQIDVSPPSDNTDEPQIDVLPPSDNTDEPQIDVPPPSDNTDEPQIDVPPPSDNTDEPQVDVPPPSDNTDEPQVDVPPPFDNTDEPQVDASQILTTPSSKKEEPQKMPVLSPAQEKLREKFWLQNKAIGIFIAIIVVTFIIWFIDFTSDSDSTLTEEIIRTFLSLLTFIIGFLFGNRDK